VRIIPLLIMTNFLSISEAKSLTGKSESSIRRIIKSIADNDKHANRDAIQPTPSEVAAFKKKEEPFAWRIREDVLLAECGKAQAKHPTKEKKTNAPTGDILSVLQQELALKNEQISKQWEVIHALNDRLREGNILMGSLQKHFALAEGKNEIVDVEPSKEASAKKAEKKAEKKSILARIFG